MQADQYRIELSMHQTRNALIPDGLAIECGCQATQRTTSPISLLCDLPLL